MLLLPTILLLGVEAIAQTPSDAEQNVLSECGNQVFYYELENLTLSSDHSIYMKRCQVQMDCCDDIICYAKAHYKGKGLDFMLSAVRGAQYAVMELCHPNADPDNQQAFKDVADCHNQIWPKLRNCGVKYAWNIAAAPKGKSVDMARFCCARNEVAECIYDARMECSTSSHQHFISMPKNYLGLLTEEYCSDNLHFKNADKCKELPSIASTGDKPPSAAVTFAKIATILSSQ